MINDDLVKRLRDGKLTWGDRWGAMTETAIRKLYPSVWIDPGDKSTWFKDKELTVPAETIEEVSWLKNKASNEGGHVNVRQMGRDKYGVWYEQAGTVVHVYDLAAFDKLLSPEELDVLERKFAADMGIKLTQERERTDR